MQRITAVKAEGLACQGHLSVSANSPREGCTSVASLLGSLGSCHRAKWNEPRRQDHDYYYYYYYYYYFYFYYYVLLNPGGGWATGRC